LPRKKKRDILRFYGGLNSSSSTRRERGHMKTVGSNPYLDLAGRGKKGGTNKRSPGGVTPRGRTNAKSKEKNSQKGLYKE